MEAPDGSADQSAVKENFKEFKCTSDTRRQAETHTHSIKQTDTVCVSYSGGSSSNRAAEGGGGQLCHRRSISSSSQHTKSRPLPPVLRRGSTRHHPGFGLAPLQSTSSERSTNANDLLIFSPFLVPGDDHYGRKLIVFSSCCLPPSHQLNHRRLLE